MSTVLRGNKKKSAITITEFRNGTPESEKDKRVVNPVSPGLPQMLQHGCKMF